MQVDQRYSGMAIRKFAGMLNRADPEVVAQLEAMFDNNQSDEFYLGLLSGLASSEVLLRHGRHRLIPLLVAFVAERIEKREVI